MINVFTVLKQARERIAKKENWCQGHYVKTDDNGNEQYCAIGAIEMSVYASMASHTDDAQFALIMAARIEMISDLEVKEGLANFNDSSTHAEVLALFDRHIAALEKKQL